MAGFVGLKSVDDNPIMARNVHIFGTENVLSCNKRVIFTSVLGSYDGVQVVTENTVTTPKHEYFIQKLQAEKMIREASHKNVVLRFGTLYGVSSNMRDDLLVHTLVREATTGKIKIFQPNVMRPITYIGDAVSALAFFSTSKVTGGLFNVVSRNCTKRTIAELAAGMNNANLEIVDEVDIENRNYQVSTDMIQRLGFRFSDNLESNIAEISEYYNRVLNKV